MTTDAEYKAWVKTLPCCVCRAPSPSDPHHVIGFGRGMMGGKAIDLFAVPLCRAHHNEIHQVSDLKSQVGWLHDTLSRARAEGIL